MDTKKLEIAINQLERVHRDMNDCANRFILKDVIDQLQEQVKLFTIPDVVGRSEQLVCPRCDSKNIDPTFYTDGYGCNSCGEYWAK